MKLNEKIVNTLAAAFCCGLVYFGQLIVYDIWSLYYQTGERRYLYFGYALAVILLPGPFIAVWAIYITYCRR